MKQFCGMFYVLAALGVAACSSHDRSVNHLSDTELLLTQAWSYYQEFQSDYLDGTLGNVHHFSESESGQKYRRIIEGLLEDGSIYDVTYDISLESELSVGDAFRMSLVLECPSLFVSFSDSSSEYVVRVAVTERMNHMAGFHG